jgi:hypothetical protein
MAAHAGFDCSDYPGDQVMAWLRANTNLAWCGYYLAPAPSHSATSWMGKRGALNAAGWGIAPLYVGEQVIGHGSQHPSGAKGQTDGVDAVALMRQEQFPAGTHVYLDLEDGSLPGALRLYVEAWIDAVAPSGYQPAIYCSHVIADAVVTARPATPIWAFKVTTTADHNLDGTHFREVDPAGSGFGAARMWQLEQNALIGVPLLRSGRLKVDLSSALVPDPGAPAASGIA